MAKKAKYQIKKRTPFSHSLLPVIESLAAEGRSLADIGMMLGYAGKSPKSWMNYLKKNHPNVEDALEAGRKMADTKLVVAAFDVAIGYDIEEVHVEMINNPKLNGTGEVQNHYIEKGRKTITKHIKPDSGLLFRMLCNRLPEYFSDTKTIDINKRSLDVHATVTAEIEDFAGKLRDTANRRKQVENKVKETESNEKNL